MSQVLTGAAKSAVGRGEVASGTSGRYIQIGESGWRCFIRVFGRWRFLEGNRGLLIEG